MIRSSSGRSERTSSYGNKTTVTKLARHHDSLTIVKILYHLDGSIIVRLVARMVASGFVRRFAIDLRFFAIGNILNAIRQSKNV